MAFTQKEQEIIDWGIANGKSKQEVKSALAKYRSEQPLEEVVEPEMQDSDGVWEGVENVGSVLNTVFGGEKIGEAIGTQITKLTPGGREIRRQAREGEIPQEVVDETFDAPSAGQIAGDVARVGATFIPVGRVAQGIGRAGQAVGLGSRAAQTVGNIGAGAATGATADIGVSMAEGETPQLGLGTLLGAGIPAASPVAGAIGRAAAKVFGRVGSEVTGKLTGTSAETVEQAFIAAREGGKQLDEFTKALRGQTTPEQLVNLTRDNVAKVASERSRLFAETLAELSDEVVETAPAKAAFRETLESTGITIDENGVLNFANSKLRTTPNAQSKLQQAWREISSMPETMSLKEVDTTRQAVKAIKEISGDEPSANLANMLIEDATRSVRLAGEQVDGYGQMLDNFGETSEFLNELEKGLSVGDKRSVDQAFRRIATTLRTNNEQRMALVRELDEATDGALLSQISGQQLSEALPRGLVGTYLAPIFVGTTAAGAVTPAILPGLFLASPRAVGEFARAIGLTAAKADVFVDAVQEAQSILTKIGALGGASVEPAQ